MKKSLLFEIECGETTCSDGDKFCKYCHYNAKGSGTCFLFGKIFDEGGWLMRHPDCVKLSTTIHKITKGAK